MSATLGFESCQPAAPGMGLKVFCIAKRVCFVLPHQPERRGMYCCDADPAEPGFDDEVASVEVT